MRKALLTGILLGTMILSSIGVFATEQPTNGWWYNEGQETLMYFENGQKINTGWCTIEDKTYYFDESGFAKRGHVHMFDKEYTFNRDTGEFLGEGFLELPPLTESKYR